MLQVTTTPPSAQTSIDILHRSNNEWSSSTIHMFKEIKHVPVLHLKAHRGHISAHPQAVVEEDAGAICHVGHLVVPHVHEDLELVGHPHGVVDHLLLAHHLDCQHLGLHRRLRVHLLTAAVGRRHGFRCVPASLYVCTFGWCLCSYVPMRGNRRGEVLIKGMYILSLRWFGPPLISSIRFESTHIWRYDTNKQPCVTARGCGGS